MKKSKKIPGCVSVYASIEYSQAKPELKEIEEKYDMQIRPCEEFLNKNGITEQNYSVAQEYFWKSCKKVNYSICDAYLSVLDQEIAKNSSYKHFLVVSSRTSLSKNICKANKYIKDFSERGSKVVIIDEL